MVESQAIIPIQNRLQVFSGISPQSVIPFPRKLPSILNIDASVSVVMQLSQRRFVLSLPAVSSRDAASHPFVMREATDPELPDFPASGGSDNGYLLLQKQINGRYRLYLGVPP